MSIYIKVNNVEYPVTINGNSKDYSWDERDTKTITLSMTYTEALALLPSNTSWSIVKRDVVDKLDNEGKSTGETEEQVQEWDNSDYSVSGPITDNRDGTVSIKMGKSTEVETANTTITTLMGTPVTMMRAMALRPVIEQATESLSDNDCAKAVELLPKWSEHIGETVVVGQRMSDIDADGILRAYKVNEGQSHTIQESWPPHLTPALWTVINITSEGTKDDPILAARGMEYEYGKYYKDNEDGKIYLCKRGDEAGTITLQYLPHELINQYFVLAE